MCGRGEPETDVFIFDHVPTFVSAAKWSMEDLADQFAHLVRPRNKLKNKLAHALGTHRMAHARHRKGTASEKGIYMPKLVAGAPDTNLTALCCRPTIRSKPRILAIHQPCTSSTFTRWQPTCCRVTAAAKELLKELLRRPTSTPLLEIEMGSLTPSVPVPGTQLTTTSSSLRAKTAPHGCHKPRLRRWVATCRPNPRQRMIKACHLDGRWSG